METICYDAIDWWLQTVTNTIIKKFKIQDLKRQQSKLVDLQLHSGSITANKTKAECTLQPVAKMLTPWAKSVFNGDKEICYKSCPHYSK